MTSSGQTSNQDANYEVVCKILEGTSQRPPSADEYGLFAAAIKNKDGKQVEDCVRKWCPIASGCAEFSAFLKMLHVAMQQRLENAAALLDHTMVIHVFRGLWCDFYSLAVQFELNSFAGGFGDLIGETIGIMDVIDRFESLLFNRVTFQHLKQHLLLVFAQRWSSMAQNCYLDAQLRDKLPWWEVSICLSSDLVSLWAYRQADEIRHGLLKKLLEFQQIVNLDSGILTAKLKAFEAGLSASITNMGEPTTVNKHLTGNLNKFKDILDNCQPCKPKPGVKAKRKGAPNDKMGFDELEMMNDMKSMRRILYYLSLAKSVRHADHSDSDDDVLLDFLLVERAMQVAGEGLKGTAESANLSKNKQQALKDAGIPLEMLTDLRNALSHYNSLSVRRKQQAETSFNVSKVFHDLGKLEGVFNKVLHRLEFLLLKKLIEDERSRLVTGCQDTQLLNWLAESQTTAELESRLSNATAATTFSKKLQFLIQQFNVHSQVLGMEGLLSEGNETPHGKDISEIFKQLVVDGKAVCKSTITVVSDMKNLRMFFEEISLTANKVQTPKCGNVIIDRDDHLRELVSIIVRKNMSVEFYSSVSSELFLGSGSPVSKISIETVLKSYADKVLSSAEEMLHMVSVLQLLDAVLNVQLNRGDVGSTSCDAQAIDHFVDLIAGAPFDPVKVEMVEGVAGAIGLTDTGAQDVLLGILLDMCEGATGPRCDTDVLVSKVVREKCSVLNVHLVNENEINSARLNLMQFGKRRLNKELGNLTESEFSRYQDKINEHIKTNCKFGSKRLSSTFQKDSNRSWEGDMKLLKDSASPYEKLTTGLTRTRSLEDSCAVFLMFLTDLCVPAVNLFRSLEQKSLESFVSDRISQLAKLFTKYEIPLDKCGNGKASVDKMWPSYKRNHQLQAAVEMILLECLEILENLYRPPVNFKYQSGSLLTDKTFGNISLRNYLAHGDALLDLYNPEVCRLILDNAVELATNGERIMALRKLFEEPKIFDFIQEAEQEGKLHTVHAANVSPLTNGDVQETLSTLQSDADWETVVNKSLMGMSPSNCVPPARQLANTTGTSVDWPTKLMSEDALYLLLENDVRQFLLLVETNPQVCKHRFRDDWTILHYALYGTQGAADVIEVLVNAGADVNAADDQHLRPLHVAVLRNSMPNLEALLSCPDLDVNAATIDGITPMHMAAQLGYGDCLEALLKMGADPNVQTRSHWFPLHFASSNGHKDTVELLLTSAARANVIGSGKWSPLHLAVEHDHLGVMEILLKRGADANARLDGDDRSSGGRGVVHLAACHSSVQAMQLLLDRGVNAHSKSSGNYGFDRTPLHWAAMYGRQEMVEFLAVRPGVEKNLEDLEGSTALDYALLNHHLPIATFLLQQSWSPKPNVLVAAAAQGDIGLLKLLQEQGADLNVEAMSMTPATMAASYGRLQVLEYVMGKTDTDVEALMHAACRYGRSNVVKFLVEERHYPNIDQWFKTEQETPLHAAASQGRLRVVQYLVEKCTADIEVTDGDGNTPCMRAVNSPRNLAVANYLFENGADVGGEKGRRMLLLAARHGRWNLVKTLVERGADFSVPCSGAESVAGIAACRGSIETLNFLIEVKNYDVQQLSVASFLRHISETGKRNVLDYLRCRGLELRTPFADSGALGFHFAAAAGNTEACDFFLHDLQVGIDQADCAGLTALHYAAKGNQPHVVKYLLVQKANAALRSESGDTPLRLATKESRWQVVKSIVEGTESPGGFLDEEGNTLLHLCLKTNRKCTVGPAELQYCTDKLGARIFHSNRAGNTVLHEAACSQSKADVLNFILARAKEASTGSDFEDFLNYKDTNGNSALMLYVKGYRLAMDNTYQRAVQVFILHGADLNVQDTNKQTALHLAVAKNSKDLLTALMVPLASYIKTRDVKKHCIANPLLVDKSSLTPHMLLQKLKMDKCDQVLLQYENDYKLQFLKDRQMKAKLEAARKNFFSHELMINPLSIKVLRSDKKNVAELLNSAPELQFSVCNGKLPIHDAAAVGNVEILVLLVTAGSDINATNNLLETPLHLATSEGHKDVVEWLLSNGARHDVFNRDGNKPVHCAVKAGCVDVVESFFEKGLSDVDDLNKHDESPLVIAVEAGRNACVESLLQKYEDREQPLDNRKILNEAVVYGNLDTVELLLKKGVLSQVINAGNCPKSPLYLAVKNEQWAIALLLLETASDAQLPFLLASQGDERDALLNDASHGPLEVVKHLVERGGIDPNSTLEDGRTPLIGAVYSRSKPVVEYLLEKKANPNAFLTRTNETPLHIAAQRGYSDIAKILTDNHASIFQKCDLRYPLGTAAAKGHWETAVIILNSAGPDRQQILDNLTTFELKDLKKYAKDKNLSDDLFT